MSNSCIIIGGGVIGLFSAWEMVRAGWQVTVLDRQAIGREASWAGSGIVSPLQPWKESSEFNQLSLWAQQAYPELVRDIEQRTGRQAQLNRCGLLVLDQAEVAAACDWAIQHNVPHHILPPEQVARYEPHLALPGHDILELPAIQQVRNPRLLSALSAALVQEGVNLVADCPVTGLQIQHSTVTGVITRDGVYEADAVILAAGAWSSQLLTDCPVKDNVHPVRGQILMYQLPAMRLHRVILEQDSYLVPRQDGVLLAGSTVEYVGFDKSTTGEAAERLHGLAASLLPELEGMVAERHWAGLRPGCSAGLPMIGEHPDIKGLILNCGHFRTGLTLAPASARLVMEHLTGQASSFPVEAFRPRRQAQDDSAQRRA